MKHKTNCVLVSLVGLALAGCGGSGGSDSETAAQAGSPNAESRLPPPTAVAGAKGSSQFAGRTGARKFQALANTICNTVRTGSPAPLPRSTKPADLRRYAAAASKANQRTIVSLQRLGAPASLRTPLERLLGSLQELQSVYAEASGAQSSQVKVSSVAQSIGLAEARAGSDALASGTPSCAPHLPGVGLPRPGGPPGGDANS